jgi:hypothetical protein
MDEYTLPNLKEKELYRVVEVSTSNPRKLFRRLSDFLERMGYETDYDTDSVEIKRDEVGNSGYVNATIIAEKVIAKEEQGAGDFTFNFAEASPVKQYSLLLGVILFITGIITVLVAGNVILLIVGIIFTLIVLFSFLKRAPATLCYPVKVWITGVGEIYRAQLLESRGRNDLEQGLSQERITSDITVRVAADIDPPVKLEELESDFAYLLHELDTLNE